MALLEKTTYSPGEPMQNLYDKLNAAIDALNLVTNGNKFAVKEIPITNFDFSIYNGKAIPHGLDFAKITRVWYVVVSNDLSERILSGSRNASTLTACLTYEIKPTFVWLWVDNNALNNSNYIGIGPRGTLYIEYLK
jgi:hypothetical protein